MVKALTKEEIIDAIYGIRKYAKSIKGGQTEPDPSFGNITEVARRLGVNRREIYRYMESDTTGEIELSIRDQREVLKDWLESKLWALVEKGSVNATIWLAERIMPERGYGEKSMTESEMSVVIERESND